MIKSWRGFRFGRTLPPAVVYFAVLILFALVCDSSSLLNLAHAADGEDITISSNTSWTAGTYTYRDITVTNNATLTLAGTYSSDTNGTGVIINARNITVDSGSTISATGQGYAANAGSGKGTNVSAYGGGGSHANTGGNHAIESGGGTTLYGSVTAPLTLGSGGGNGGAGGGAIKLNLTGNLSLAGNIYAKGNNGGTNTGSGAGGSIYISAVGLSGGGNISVSGGSSGSGGGGGSGGRVMIYYTGTNSLTDGNITAAGGTGYAAGGVGSKLIYNKTTKDVTIASNITIDATMGIDSNGDPATNGVFHFRDLTVNNNANLYTKSYYTTDTNGVGVELSLSGNLNVASGAKINGLGKGYAYQAGDGKPTGTSNTYGGGGAHGGNGGRGDPAGSGGTKYDSTLFPVKPGSGGYTTRGGAGGSAVKITASAVTIDGSIDQSGSAVVANGSNNGGGGAGGSVYIVANTLSGTGTIKADGTNGYGYSGGGGGGRIAVYADTSGFNTGNITAAKGTKGGSGLSADGDVGTIFLYDTASGNVSASSDVTFNADQGVSRDGTARTDGVFYFNNLTVTNNSTVTIGGYYTNDSNGRGVTINLDGNLTVNSGSTITATGQGYAGANGPGKGTGASSTSGAGGSYGGLGGTSYNANQPGSLYGTTEANYPYYLGSGGGNGDGGVGGAGGGAMTFRVLGNATINGTISANGASGTGGFSSWRPGGGSGGSIFIIADTISGSGTISANGGAAPGDVNYSPGAGGGGRISLVYSTTQNISLGNISANGGTAAQTPTRNGAAGSINITQRVLPAANFSLRNPNNGSTEFTNTENVEIVPTDSNVQKYKEAASASDLVPAFYDSGWANVSDGKDVGASEGSKNVRAWFKDGNELISSAQGTAAITLDKTNPSASITNNNLTIGSPSVTVSLTLSDNLSGIDYVTVSGQRVSFSNLRPSVNDKGGSNIKAFAAETTYETPVSLTVGSNEIPIVVYDKAGNSVSLTFLATRTESITPTPSATSSTSSTASTSTASTTSATSSTSEDEATSGSSNSEDSSTDLTTSTTDSNTATSTPSATKIEDGVKSSTSKFRIYYLISSLIAIAIIGLVLKSKITRDGRKR